MRGVKWRGAERIGQERIRGKEDVVSPDLNLRAQVLGINQPCDGRSRKTEEGQG